MKTRWLVAAALALLAFQARDASALYSPNPAGRWAGGHFFLAGDFLYDDEKELEPGGKIENRVGFFARPAYTITDNVIAYGRLGFMDSDNFDDGFAFGGGLQASWLLPNARDWAVGGAFDIINWDLDDVDYTEIQLTPAASYNVPQIPELTPYVGVAIDFLTGDLDEDSTVGPVIGTNYDLNGRLRFDAQVRFVTETGIGLSAGYLF